MTGYEDHDWIRAAKAHGWGDLLGVALDALAPLGPLGAQLVWTAQPALGLFVRRDTLVSLARSLEAPGGIEALRRVLEDDGPSAEEPS
jgi:hypothetical protein